MNKGGFVDRGTVRPGRSTVGGRGRYLPYPVPPVVVGQGLNITVMSYLDSVGIGFLCDGDMIKDPWELADAAQPCLDELAGRR